MWYLKSNNVQFSIKCAVYSQNKYYIMFLLVYYSIFECISQINRYLRVNTTQLAWHSLYLHLSLSPIALILSRLRSAYLPRVNIIRSAACLPDWLRSPVSETERLQWNWQADSRDGGQTKCALWRAWRRHRCLGPFTFDSGQKQKKGWGGGCVCLMWWGVGVAVEEGGGFCQSVSQ